MKLVQFLRQAALPVAAAFSMCLAPMEAFSQLPPAPKVTVAVNPITNKVYVVNEMGNTVTVIDEAAGTRRVVPVPGRPQFIAVDPAANRVYVNTGNDSSLTVLDGSTDTNLTPTPLALGSLGPMAIDSARGIVYVVRLTSAARDEVTFFNATNQTWYSIAALMYQPISMGVSPISQDIFVAGYATGRLAIIDGAFSGEGYPCGHSDVGSPCPMPGTGSRPIAVALNPVSNQAFGISENPFSALWIVDGATGGIQNFAIEAGPNPPPPGPRGIAVNPVTNKAYAVFDGKLVVVSGATRSFTVIPDSRFAGGTPVGVAVNAATNRIYVATSDGRLTVIDGATNALTPFAIPMGSHSIGVNPVTNKVYLHDGGATTTILDGLGTAGSVPLTTTVTPLPGNQGATDTTLQVQATSGFAPNALPIRMVYWQLDGTTGAWQAASGTGPWTIALTGLAPGSHTIHAFAVDGQDAPLNTGPQSAPLVGTRASYTFTVPTSGATVSLAASAATSTAGQPVTFTASVSGGSGTPTGNVGFRDGGVPMAGCGSVALVSGSAACTLSTLTAGSHSITAQYAGNATYGPATSSPVTHTVTSSMATPTVALASSRNPSTAGQSVTFTATVSGSAGTPAGTVQFRDGGTAIAGCTAVALASGTATCATTSLPVGTRSITAHYSGSQSYNPAASNVVSQSVAAATVTPTVALASSRNPSTAGQVVTFTASVSGSAGVASGTVQFRDGGTAISGCSSVALASGTAACSTTALPVGTRSITAHYGGSVSYNAAASSALSQSVTANTVTPAMSLASSKNPSRGGDTVTFTANVSGSAGMATGTVEFRDGGVAIGGCGAVTLASGSAACATASLTVGSHSITAHYGGGGAYTAAASGALSQTVAAADSPQATLSTSTLPFGGQSMGTRSPVQVVSVTNTGTGSLTINAVTASNGQFVLAHNCATLAPGASCSVSILFAPAAGAGPLNVHTPVTATLTVTSNASSSPASASLSGMAEKSLVTHYYRSILRRAPDAGALEYWEGEAARVAALGANVNEAWYALAMTFFSSAEYGTFNRTDAAFITDLYRTFFNREPDAAGLDYWSSQMAQGAPREVVLVEFMLSAEFRAFAQSIFGNTAARAEVDVVGDFYRGLLARLPDNSGFESWVAQFRAAQCSGGNAVNSRADAISASFVAGQEYAARLRDNSDFVADMYNAFLRRGGDLAGVRYWIGQLDSGARTRENVRQAFVQTPEFQRRVQAMIDQGCRQ